MRCRIPLAASVALLSLSTVLLLVACSSLPKQEKAVTAVQAQAASYAKDGNRAYSQGQYAQAERYFNLALDQDFSIDDRYGIAASYNSLGRVYLAAGKLDLAATALSDAARYAGQSSNPKGTLLRVEIETGRAEVELMRGKPQSARTILQQAQSLGPPAGSIEQANLLHDLGATSKALGDYAAALTDLQRAQALHEQLKRPGLEASDRYMIASVYSKQGDFPKALAAAHAALSIDKLIENRPGIGSDLRALGIISERAGDEQAAYDYLYGALQVYRTLNLAPEVQDLLPRLVHAATTLGKKEAAARYRAAITKLQGGTQ